MPSPRSITRNSYGKASSRSISASGTGTGVSAVPDGSTLLTVLERSREGAESNRRDDMVGGLFHQPSRENQRELRERADHPSDSMWLHVRNRNLLQIGTAPLPS